jgi:hypothetical protein
LSLFAANRNGTLNNGMVADESCIKDDGEKSNLTVNGKETAPTGGVFVIVSIKNQQTD